MVVNLSSQDIKDLEKAGYSKEEINKAVQEIEREDLEESRGGGANPQRSQSQNSAFSTGRQMDDIARFQLELNDLLEQTEHVLKGDVVEFEDGVKVWKPNPYPEKNPLNDEGIRKLMLELQTYINRHIILGDYEDDDIRVIMKDYGNKVNNYIFMKYEEMGMDTEEKRQEYASLVMNIVNLVYASYSRAKDGAERRSLREMINISQNQSSQMMPGQMMQGQMPGQKTRGILNPMRYIQGKYVT